ncbi:hypothetical protein [Kitasatospora sp. NPDC096140]|uniref:hypothetical protein n=1 Tax=Kitasatospora sp. NPDC096140 TaxID=3155425 RepID=UPI00333479F4
MVSVLVGTRNAGEARDAAAMLRHPVPDELWVELKDRDLLPPDVPTPQEAP